MQLNYLRTTLQLLENEKIILSAVSFKTDSAKIVWRTFLELLKGNHFFVWKTDLLGIKHLYFRLWCFMRP